MNHGLHYIGSCCDLDGTDLPDGAPPSHNHLKSREQNSWHPFSNQAHFELADFLFRKNEMSGARVDELMQIWAKLNQQEATHSDPPFTSANDLFQKIDQINASETWQSFSFSHTSADLPQDELENLPSWKQTTYELVIRNIKSVVQDQLACPELKNHIDYCPHQIFGDHNKRIWSDFMSGNWAWEQCVSLCPLIFTENN